LSSALPRMAVERNRQCPAQDMSKTALPCPSLPCPALPCPGHDHCPAARPPLHAEGCAGAGAGPRQLHPGPDRPEPHHRAAVCRCRHRARPPSPGLCLNSLGSECSPKRTKLEQHNIVVYVNATPYCTTIQLEHHRGPCRSAARTAQLLAIRLGPCPSL
jgi:hypothetical protein